MNPWRIAARLDRTNIRFVLWDFTSLLHLHAIFHYMAASSLTTLYGYTDNSFSLGEHKIEGAKDALNYSKMSGHTDNQTIYSQLRTMRIDCNWASLLTMGFVIDKRNLFSCWSSIQSKTWRGNGRTDVNSQQFQKRSKVRLRAVCWPRSHYDFIF